MYTLNIVKRPYNNSWLTIEVLQLNKYIIDEIFFTGYDRII